MSFMRGFFFICIVTCVLYLGYNFVGAVKVQAQTPNQAVTCAGFELRNVATQTVIQAGSSVTAGTRVSYKPIGCSAGWTVGTRTAEVTNKNAFPTDHTQCAALGAACETTAVYMGTGTRLYFRTNLQSNIGGNQYICRHTGGWDSLPAGLVAPSGYICGLGSGLTYAYVNVTESTDNQPCYSNTDNCTSKNLNNCTRAGSKYTLYECLRSLQATACKLNETDYVVAVPVPSAKGWYEDVGGRQSYVAGYNVYRSSTLVQSVEFRGLSYYCPDGPDRAGGECALNRLDIPAAGQPNITQVFGTSSSFNFQLARPITNHCGAFQIDPYFVKINGQSCTKEAGTAAYGVCNLTNYSQRCNLPADWRASCAEPTPTPTRPPITITGTTTPTRIPTLTPTPALAPLCVSVTASKSPIQYGDRVTFTCGLVPAAASYEFRVIAPDGSISYVPTDHANVSGQYLAQGTLSGRYIAQCRVCPNAELCAQDRNYGWDSNPYLP